MIDNIHSPSDDEDADYVTDTGAVGKKAGRRDRSNPDSRLRWMGGRVLDI